MDDLNTLDTDLGLFSLLSDAQGEDYKEEQFANRMKKKEKGRNCRIDFEMPYRRNP